MAKAWTDKREYQRLLGELSVSDGRDFEAKVIPLLRIMFPDLVYPRALGSLDRIGADLIVWGPSPFPLVVQCKGFQVREDELGQRQVKQVAGSINTFLNSGARARRFLLLLNRFAKEKSVRDAIQAELVRLQESGRVESAELWNSSRIVTEAFNATLRWLQQGFAERARAGATANDASNAFVVSAVPHKVERLVADQHGLLATEESETLVVADPADQLSADPGCPLTLVIGEAGYGKTTTMLRSAGVMRNMILVPAARIGDGIHGAKDLLKLCVDLDDIFEELDGIVDSKTLDQLTRPVIEYLFKDVDTPAILVLDGIDESAFLAHRGRVQWLLNMLRGVAIPVVMTVRSEFWIARLSDFASPFGKEALSKPQRRRQQVRKVELLPWQDVQILELAEHVRDQANGEGAAQLSRFIELVRRGAYTEEYGDIPRRPLFLRFILDTLAAGHKSPTRMSSLIDIWTRAKLQRDLENPILAGGAGRLPLTGEHESVDTLATSAFEVMMTAASCMTRASGGLVELLGYCTYEELRASSPVVLSVEPTALVLNSLLVPDRSSRQPLRLRFAHRVFQEYFLARAARRGDDAATKARLPAAVQTWLDEITRDEA